MSCVRFGGVVGCASMKTSLAFKMLAGAIAGAVFSTAAAGAGDYQVFVSNEKAGTVTVISGSDWKVTATIPVGKRPRGIHASPDGKIIYVALSGTPIEPPPQLDANGNPIFKRNAADDDDQEKADKSADGIGLVDVAQKKFLRKIPAGSDPEQFCLSADGARIYIANEDVSAATDSRREDRPDALVCAGHARAGRRGRQPGRKIFLRRLRNRRRRFRD